jgi:putative ABC transport system permease protein
LLDANSARIKISDTFEPANADIKFVSADQEFIPAYGVKIVAGRSFSKDFSTDTAPFLSMKQRLRRSDLSRMKK